MIVKDEAAHAVHGLSPLKLYESMAAGVSVVVSDIPGLRDTVEQCGCGVVVPAGDASAIAGSVRALSRDTESARMGERGRLAAVAHHSWDTRAAQTEKVLLRALAGRL